MILLPSTRQRIAAVPLLFRAHDCLDEQGLFALSYGRKVYAVFTRTGHAGLVDQDGRQRRAPGGAPRVVGLASSSGARRPTLLIEPATTNLMLRSSEFDHAAWSKSNANVTANAATARDGSVSVDALLEDSINAGHYCFQGVTVISAATYTASFLVKAAGRSVFQICFATGQVTGVGDPRANFDLAAGVIGTVDAAIAARMVPEGDGFYRCSATVTTTGTGLTPIAMLATSPTDARAPNYLGNGVSGVLIADAELTAGQVPTSRVPTSAATASRGGELLYFPFVLPGQSLTAYCAGVELGTSILTTTTHHWWGIGSAGAPRLIGLRNGTRRWGAFLEHGSTATSSPSEQISFRDDLEMRAVVRSAGTVLAGQALNGGGETLGAVAGPVSSGMPTSWAEQRFYFGGSSAFNQGIFGFRAAAVKPGEISRDELRDLCEVG